MSALQRIRPSLDTECRVLCAERSITNDIASSALTDHAYESPTDRAKYIDNCFATDNDSCKRDETAQNVKPSGNEEEEDIKERRSDADVDKALTQLTWYVASESENYQRGKHDLGLDVYSTSSTPIPHVTRVQAQRARPDQQLKFLNDILLRLMGNCEHFGFSGVAAYVGRYVDPQGGVSQATVAHVAQRVREVDSVFATMRRLPGTVAVTLNVVSEPTENAHFTMGTQTGWTEIDAITNSGAKNAYRGFYQYAITADGMLSGDGQINLIDQPGTRIVCHLRKNQKSTCEAQ